MSPSRSAPRRSPVGPASSSSAAVASPAASPARSLLPFPASGSYGVGIAGGSGTMLVTDAGIAGDLRGTITASLPAGVALTGAFALLVNNTNTAVAETLTISGASISLDVARGPFVRFAATGARLDVLGQAVTADVAVERSTVFGTGGQPDTTVFRFGISNGSLAFGGASPLLSASDASGSIVVTSSGVAGRLQATVALNVPGASLAGTFAAEVNT